jgi:class 3 adenylate cyclase/tetratricopeptide (TPR) repeat protein
LKRKIAVILAADIAGYSRLIAEDEEETLRRFEGYRAVFSEFVERGGGRIFNTAGDAILAEFQSAVEAVRCAVDVQETLKARNLAYPPSRHMNFRIGITIGDVVEREGGDLLGDGVNIAARLESVAPPGGICVSRSVHEAVASKMTLRFSDAGPQALKNIPERVHAYTLSIEGANTGAVVLQQPPPKEPAKQGKPAAPATSAARPTIPVKIDLQSNWLTLVLAGLAVLLAGIYAYEYLPRSTPDPAPVATAPAEPAETVKAPAAETPSETAVAPSAAESAQSATADGTRAEQATEAALRTAPNPLASRYVLTRQWKDCHESDNADVAADACKGLLDSGGLTDDDEATIRYKYGRALRDKGEPDKAIESYDRAIALKRTADALNHRGIAYFDKGNYAEAITNYTEALKLRPNLAEAINNRAWTYYKSGDLASALQDANRAVSLDGSKAYIWDTRGHIHEARGAKSAAISDYRKALNLDPGSESSSEGLARLGAN